MSTTQRQTVIRPDAPAATQSKRHLGLAAAGAVVVAGLGTGLTALIIGVTADSDTDAPSPDVPPSVEVQFDPSDPQEMRGIDNWLYQLAEQRQRAGR